MSPSAKSVLDVLEQLAFRALALAPALVQLVYVVPVRRGLLARGHATIAKGILVGAVAAGRLNLAVVGLVAWMTRGFD